MIYRLALCYRVLSLYSKSDCPTTRPRAQISNMKLGLAMSCDNQDSYV